MPGTPRKLILPMGFSGSFPFRLIVAENDLKAKAFYEDFRLYDPEVLYYPARDLIFYQADIHGNLLTRQRIQVLRALLEREEVTDRYFDRAAAWTVWCRLPCGRKSNKDSQ